MAKPDMQPADCRISGAALLTAESGGADALCQAIRRARGRGAAGQVEVRVESPNLLVAKQTLASGEILPEIRTARSDRPLGHKSFDMLARALAAQLAERSQ